MDSVVHLSQAAENYPTGLREEATASPFYTTNPKTVTYYRLEGNRLERLNLHSKYSRQFNVMRASRKDRLEDSSGGQQQDEAGHHLCLLGTGNLLPGQGQGPSKANSVAPFATLGKPTCGVFFSRETDNKKKKFGIPPSDLVKWRNFPGHSTGTPH